MSAPPDVITDGARGIERAAAHLRAGELVALPTETVYGLAACAGDGAAVAKVFAAKGRPAFNPLIVHVEDALDAKTLALWTPQADALARAFWPGPLTLVLDKIPGAGVSDLATAGLDTIALRAPAHPVARAVIANAGPLAMPSANPSGRISPTTAADVARDFATTVDLVIDGGPARHGLESTVVALTENAPRLLRPGPITAGDIEAVLGAPIKTPIGANPARPQSPGLLIKHYAPARARLRLNADSAKPGEAFLAFGPAPPSVWPTLSLSPGADLMEAAARLFSALRALDGAGYASVAVAPIPERGIGAAINDRLKRAASS